VGGDQRGGRVIARATRERWIAATRVRAQRLAPLVLEGANALADLLLPRSCVVCERLLDPGEREMVCGRCWARLPLLAAPRCDRCGHPTNGQDCRWCEVLPPYVRAARSVCWATDGVSLGIVHALKYQGWYRVARDMGRRMSRLDWPTDVVEEGAALVPVPLSAKRERQRGYNQSECLSRELTKYWRIPTWTDVLARTRHTETQTRLTPGDRLRNVSGAFRARATPRNALRGRHIILVDDVVTTAATLNACAAALCDGGARIVSFVTFGRAPALGDRC
jgi:ComF family protein